MISAIEHAMDAIEASPHRVLLSPLYLIFVTIAAVECARCFVIIGMRYFLGISR